MTASRDTKRLQTARSAEISVIVALAFLFSLGVRLSHAVSAQRTTTVCDGIDDDTDAPFVCGLPEKSGKDQLVIPVPHPMHVGELLATRSSERAVIERLRWNPVAAKHRRFAAVKQPPSRRSSASDEVH